MIRNTLLAFATAITLVVLAATFGTANATYNHHDDNDVVCTQQLCGDVDGTGAVVATDALAILRLAVGLDQPGDSTEQGVLCQLTLCNEDECETNTLPIEDDSDAVCYFDDEGCSNR